MGGNEPLNTKFASAEREPVAKIKHQSEEFLSNKMFRQILDAVPEAVLVLNKQRQIVFVNKATVDTLGLDDWQMVCGLRPGEILRCNHSTLEAGGCGTSKFCKYCGAVTAILMSQEEGKHVENECRITQSGSGDALDLKVKAAPLEFNDNVYTVFTVLDISDQKRKQVLQRIFFHDILNTAGGLSGFSELLQSAKTEEAEEYKEAIFELSQRIVDEINSQRQLLAAENDELEISVGDVNSLDLIQTVADAYKSHLITGNRKVKIDENAESILIKSDEVLLSRVLGNLVKNALEATDPMQTVMVGCQKVDDTVQFSVKNHRVMPDSVKMQIFKRSFSTKGDGRGLGTYSIKLFTEKYLKGKVEFTSNEEEGTTFFVSYPIEYS